MFCKAYKEKEQTLLFSNSNFLSSEEIGSKKFSFFSWSLCYHMKYIYCYFLISHFVWSVYLYNLVLWANPSFSPFQNSLLGE